MRRFGLYVFLAIIAAVALVSYYMAQRQVVMERPYPGGPPPRARRHENLVGRTAGDFTGRDQHGQAVGMAALRGRVVVLNVWATWCGPCIEELPRLEREVWQRFRPDVAVIAVARGESAAKVREFNRRVPLTFALVADPRRKISRRFGGDDLIPRTYVISRSGVVVHQTLGYGDKSFDRLVSEVERAVAQR